MPLFDYQSHIANGYLKTIWVIFHSRVFEVNEVNGRISGDISIVSASLSGSADLKITCRDADAKYRIIPGQYVKYRHSNSAQRMTIIAKHPNHRGRVKLLGENLQCGVDRSYVFDEEGQIHESEYGRIWYDTHGNNLQPQWEYDSD